MPPEAVLICGIQGAGKSTLVRERFFDTHVRISRDLLRTPHRERRFLQTCLETRQPFVVDKINATAADRAPFVAAAQAAGFRTAAYWLDVRPRDAIERNGARSGRARIPVQAILGTYKRLEVPRFEEGFDEIWRVEVLADGFRVVSVPRAAPAPSAAGRAASEVA